MGKGHPEFSSMHQQDAVEYVQHLLDVMTRAEHASGTRLGAAGGGEATAAMFQFELEDRTQCVESGEH